MRQDGQVPYQKSLKVKVSAAEAVFNYRNEKGEEKSLVNAAICDESMAVKYTIYDQARFGRFRKGASIIVRNVIKNADSIVITSATKVFPISELAVPEERMQEGHNNTSASCTAEISQRSVDFTAKGPVVGERKSCRGNSESVVH